MSRVSREYGAGDVAFTATDGVGMKLGTEWNGIRVEEISRAHVEGKEPYVVLYDWARSRVREKKLFDVAVRADERNVHDWTQRLEEARSKGERTDAPKFIAQFQQQIDETRLAERVQGIASLGDKMAFAIRSRHSFPDREGDGYTVGYLDSDDQVVRLFIGVFEGPQPESPQAASAQYQRFRNIYRARVSTRIPTARGYCTPRGLFDEPENKPLAEAHMGMSFTSTKFPGLIFQLEVAPPSTTGPWNIHDVPYDGFPVLREPGGRIRHSHGPRRVRMAEQPARVFGNEYGVLCYNQDQCVKPNDAYLVFAQTLGELGTAYRPAIKLSMAGILDPGRRRVIASNLSMPVEEIKPPSFDEAMKVFDGIVKSIRVRPGAVTSTAGSVYGPAAAASASSRDAPNR